MSIQNNTEGLQRILQVVNDLPDVGSSSSGGSSGGVTYQRKDGSFTTTRRNNGDYADATVNDCGFKPDVVIVKAKGYNYDGTRYYYDMIAVFPEQVSNRTYSIMSMDDTYASIECEIIQSDNGFYFDMWAYDWDWEDVAVSAQTYDYVAIKYT